MCRLLKHHNKRHHNEVSNHNKGCGGSGRLATAAASVYNYCLRRDLTL
jgi:hypothetical protein